jgi:hypothetical protein
MAMQNIFPAREARYVRIPRELESKAYIWPEYAMNVEEIEKEGESIGNMFFARFGSRTRN